MVVMPNTTSDLEPLLELFAHPLEPLDYMVIRWTSNSKFSSLASNSSKSRTLSPVDEVAKKSRTDLVEFFYRERERESWILLCEKLGKETDQKRERLRLLKEVSVFSK